MTTLDLALDIRKRGGRLGAEIHDVDLTGDLSDGTVAEIRAALLEHKVLFFRGQDLDDVGQVAFASRLGPLTTAHPTVPGADEQPEVLPIEGQANRWHTDVTFIDRPPLASVLRAVVIPPYGGDTVWADTAAAYDDLPAELKVLADSLWATHSNLYDYAAEQPEADDEAKRQYREVFTATVYETDHPVVRVHPETGRRSLLLGGFAQRILGLSSADSKALLDLFATHVQRLENTVRWHWAPGDVVIWDNRSTQHYAVADYDTLPRQVRRVTVAGDVPVSADGRRSIGRVGDASDYSALA
jgi:alpha-ketoglutarate-dependent taurine dioxygenase